MSHVHVAIIRSERRTVGFALHVWCTTMCEIITCNWLSIEHISEYSPTKNSVMTFWWFLSLDWRPMGHYQPLDLSLLLQNTGISN